MALQAARLKSSAHTAAERFVDRCKGAWANLLACQGTWADLLACKFAVCLVLGPYLWCCSAQKSGWGLVLLQTNNAAINIGGKRLLGE